MFVIVMVIAIITLIAAAKLDDWQSHRSAPVDESKGQEIADATLAVEKARDAQVKPFTGIRVG